MAPMIFARAILASEPLRVFNNGEMWRDFTYIDDIVAGVVGCLDRPPAAAAGAPPVRLLNIGNNQAESVSALVALLEQALGRQAVVRFAPRPAADVEETCAAVEAISALTGFAPRTPLSEGIPRFAAWLLAWRRTIL